MVDRAREAHPELRFERIPGEQLELGETFDYIVLSDLMPYVDDLLELFHRVAEHSHERTRVIVNSYSRVWRPVFRLAELLRLKPRQAAAQLGRAARRRQPARARGVRAGAVADEDPVPEADPAS